MSLETALDTLQDIVAGTPATPSGASPFVLSKAHALGHHNFWFEWSGGAFVIPMNDGREVIDIDLVVAFRNQQGASANRARYDLTIYNQLRDIAKRLPNTDLWNRPTSGIKRLTVTGRESMSWSFEDNEEEKFVVAKVSFPLEFT